MRRQMNTIFCATDFSKLAQEVVAYGITLAQEFNAKLIVCHVVDFPTVSMYGEAVTGPIEHQNRFMDYAKSEISRLVGEAPVESPCILSGEWRKICRS